MTQFVRLINLRWYNHTAGIRIYPFRTIRELDVLGGLQFRGDVYDHALTALFFIFRSELYPEFRERAKRLLDTILFLQENDPVPDGRLRAAYYANNLIDPVTGSLRIADNSVGIGNLSYCGISLTRFYYVLQKNDLLQPEDEKYLNAARMFANWILVNCKQNDSFGGFSMGMDASGQPFTPAARSTEHNIDVYVFAKNLYHLTADSKWHDMAEHAQEFVRKMYHTDGGKYWLGTKEENGGIVINYWPVSADAQSWTTIARLDETSHLSSAMQYLMANLYVSEEINDRIYCGVRFTTGGNHIQCETTASIPMAQWLLGRKEDADNMLRCLDDIRIYASPDDDGIEDGLGIVATPHPDGAATGFINAVYPHLLHTASSAWTGMAVMLIQGNNFANPLKMIPIPADLDENAYVDLCDFAIFAEHWLETSCGYPDWCKGCDFNQSTNVNITDFAAFSEFWLKSER